MASRFAAALPMRSSVPMSESLHSIRRMLKPSFMQNIFDWFQCGVFPPLLCVFDLHVSPRAFPGPMRVRMQYGSCLENQSLSFRFFPSTSVTESIPLYIVWLQEAQRQESHTPQQRGCRG